MSNGVGYPNGTDSIVIATGAGGKTAAISLGGGLPSNLIAEAGLVTSNFTFEVGYTSTLGATPAAFYPLYIEAGTLYTLTSVAASTAYVIRPDYFAGVTHVKLVSVTDQTTGTHTIRLLWRIPT